MEDKSQTEETQEKDSSVELIKQPWLLVLTGTTLIFVALLLIDLPVDVAKVGLIIGSGLTTMFLGSSATAIKADAPLSGAAMFAGALMVFLMLVYLLPGVGPDGETIRAGIGQFKDSPAEAIGGGLVGLIGATYHAAQERANRARGLS